VPGLTELFAEVDAPAPVQPVEDTLPPDELDDPADSTTPVAPAAVPSSVANAVAAAPTRTDVGDRILLCAFQFARSISVLVIMLSLSVTAGGSTLAVYELLPSPPRLPPGSVDKPTLAEFVDVCSQRSQSEGGPTLVTCARG
jgi:hypothetical protein